MNIHEYQAKELLAKYGVPIPAGYAALTVDEAVAAAGKLPGPLYVVKAQIHAGGRGKGKFKELGAEAKGGVRLSKTLDEVRANATDMLGNTLVTIQTGDAAKEVNLTVQMEVRLEGTNVQQGKDILANSGLPIVSANDLGDAARKIVAEVKQAA